MEHDLRIRTENLRNIVVEALNAGDAALLAESIDGGDLPKAMETALVDIRERWPRMVLSAGTLGDLPVAVVWMPDEHEAYVPVAHLEFVLDGEPVVSVVEGVDPDLVHERPSARHVREWESTATMDRGADPAR